MPRTLEQSTMRKVYLRILPFAALTYFFCYLDRINVGFAALTMNKDLGLDAAVYGMAAGAFFWGYVLFEVPSNIILEKVGARLWIARIMVTWGLISGATAFCTGPYSFMAIRFLLGLAEAGLFPGFVLFFTYWFPDKHRARINSGFTLALPIAVATGAPISTALLGLDGLWGLKGWQCMYIFEAIPTVLIGIAVLFYLTDKPEQARWLPAAERDWLTARIAGEKRRVAAEHGIGLLRAFLDQGAAAVAELSRHRHRQPRHASVPAPDRQAARTDQHAGRLGDDDPLCLRRGQHGGVRLALRPHRRAALEPVLDLRDLDAGPGHRRQRARHLVVADRHVDRRHRLLRHQGAVLGDPDDVADRHRRRGRHRLDQLVRQSRRVFRPDHGRLGQEPDRQLCRRALCARRLRSGLVADFAVLPARADARRRRRGGGGGRIGAPGPAGVAGFRYTPAFSAAAQSAI